MILETERLELVPLTPRQLQLWIEDISALEKELNCSYHAEPMRDFFLEIVKGQCDATLKDPDRYYWHSFFFLIRKIDRIVIGSADFKDVPNEKGEVEIGYGLGADYEHNGYMTEAVSALCEWALKQKEVSSILAETELNGFASQNILKRNGFQVDRQEETFWWRRKKEDIIK